MTASFTVVGTICCRYKDSHPLDALMLMLLTGIDLRPVEKYVSIYLELPLKSNGGDVHALQAARKYYCLLVYVLLASEMEQS